MGVWHTYSTRQTLSELETDKSRGLSGAEAERRLARWGPNRLEEGRRQGLLLRFLGQMKDPMILVLRAAAALSLWASGGEDWLDAAIILVIVVVNACISISQEDSAEKALEALRKMSAPLAKVCGTGRFSGWRPTGWCPATSSIWRRGTWCPPTPGFWRPPPSRPMRAP